MEQEIIDGNKLIAEFMGAKIGNGGTAKNPCYVNVPIWHGKDMQTWTIVAKELRYHTSWDWLMPVVEKIESYGYTVSIDKQRVVIWALGGKQFISHNLVSKILTTRECLLDFIKWYNETKSTN